MAGKEEETNTTETIQQNFPSVRVKKIMKLDKDINKIIVIEKNRKTVKLEHLRIAMKRHQPTSDFLLQSLPEPPRPAAGESPTKRNRTADKPAPEGTRRIDDFFHKSS